MVVGDDHVYTLRLGVDDGLTVGDAGVARQHKLDTLRDEPFQYGEVKAVGFGPADGDVIPDGRPLG